MASTGKSGKRKRVVLTLQQKIDICRRFKAGESKYTLMNDFNVGSSTIYDIKAQEDKLLKFASETISRELAEKRCTLHKPKMHQLDVLLFAWYQNKRADGIHINGSALIEKAKEFHKDLELPNNCAFSGGWLSRFKIRHGIKPIEQKSPSPVIWHISGIESIPQIILKAELKSEPCIEIDSKVHWDAASECFDTLLSFAQTQDCFSAEDLNQLQILHSKFLNRRQEG